MIQHSDDATIAAPARAAGAVSIWAVLAQAVAVLVAGCGADYGAEADYNGGAGDAGPGAPECFSSNECPTGWTCSEFGTCTPPSAPPDGDAGPQTPPPEVEFELGAPASSLRYVYVAMTDQGELARIDGATLAVTSVNVGQRPEVVAVAPGTDTAVVLAPDDARATIVRPTPIGDDTSTFATLPHLNQVAVDPTGRYAVAWFDLNRAIADAGGLDAVDEVGSFQDVTVLSLAPGQEQAVDLTVGFRPRDVAFDAAGDRAFVVTEDGVSVIDLADALGAGPSIVPSIPVTGDPQADPDTVEVAVAATGAYAAVREADIPELRVVGLSGPDEGVSRVIPLPATPTDVDLSPDGARAYAVLRETSQLAVVDIPGDAIDPAGVELVDLGAGVGVGSLVLAADGRRGVLFTNAAADERLTTIALDQPDYPHVTWPLEKSVRFVQLSPDGGAALVVHAKAFGDPADATTFDEFVDRSFGYSVFDIATGFAKLQLTPVDPGAVTFAPADPFAYVALDGGDDDGAVRQAQVIALDTGVVRTVALQSPPDALGVLPGAAVAFVSQRHPLGRITFVDIATGAVRTVTGFDLNSQIID